MDIDDKTERIFKLKDIDFGTCFKFSNTQTNIIEEDLFGRYLMKVRGEVFSCNNFTKVVNDTTNILIVDLLNGEIFSVVGDALVKPLNAKVEVEHYD